MSSARSVSSRRVLRRAKPARRPGFIQIITHDPAGRLHQFKPLAKFEAEIVSFLHRKNSYAGRFGGTSAKGEKR